jgi:hypothetical protein
MPYVSARYAPPIDGTGPQPEGLAPQVIAVDHNGIEYYFMEDSQVGDWLGYLAKGGTIDPYVAPAPLEEQK